MSNPLNENNSSFSNFSLNSSTTGHGIFFLQYYYHFLASVVVGLLICVFAVVSNAICLLTICTYPKLRSRGAILVANLVIINILLSLTVFPTTIISALYVQYYPLTRNFCDWAFYYFFVTHSFVWHECLLSLNRFIAVVVPHKYKAISSRKSLLFTVILGYLISFSINAYGLRTRPRVYGFTLPFGTCLYNPSLHTIFPSIHAVLGVYIPMCVIGMSYLSIFIVVYLRKNRVNETVGPLKATRMHTMQMRIVRMLFVSFLWNTLTSVPQSILSAFIRDLYVKYPPAFFYGRYALFFGVAGNTVSLQKFVKSETKLGFREFFVHVSEPMLVDFLI